MSTVPLELPLSAAETGAFAELVLDQLDGKPLNDEARARLEGRAGTLRLSSFTIHPGSIAQDPIHPSTYYVAVDADAKPFLLRVALASSPSSGLFPAALLIGRMRTNSGREVVVNAIPFACTDRENICMFAERVDTAFLPRAQGRLLTIAVECRNPETVLPVVFQAFRTILKRSGVNLAAVVATGDYEHVYHAAVWAAIRSGWREGYTIGADIDMMTDVSALLKYTKLTLMNPESLEQAQRVYDAIRIAKNGQAHWRNFDFEVPGEWAPRFRESGVCRRLDADGIPKDEIVPAILTLAEGLRA